MFKAACSDFKYLGNRISGIQEANKPTGTMHVYSGNTGTPATSGIITVPLAAGATSGSAVIPNGQSTLNYYLTKLDVNASASADFVSLSTTTINISRTSAVGVALSSLVAYTAR
jgi:hypothetical protein